MLPGIRDSPWHQYNPLLSGRWPISLSNITMFMGMNHFLERTGVGMHCFFKISNWMHRFQLFDMKIENSTFECNHEQSVSEGSSREWVNVYWNCVVFLRTAWKQMSASHRCLEVCLLLVDCAFVSSVTNSRSPLVQLWSLLWTLLETYFILSCLFACMYASAVTWIFIDTLGHFPEHCIIEQQLQGRLWKVSKSFLRMVNAI